MNLLLCLVLGLSAATDLARGKIYNAVTYPAAAAGILLNSLLADGVGAPASLAGFAVGFVPFFALFAMGLMNGGDVKLLGAIGALKGYPFILHAIFLSFLVASFLALARLIWLGRLLRTLRATVLNAARFATPGLVVEHPTDRETIPFGVAALVGCLWALVLSEGPVWGSV